MGLTKIFEPRCAALIPMRVPARPENSVDKADSLMDTPLHRICIGRRTERAYWIFSSVMSTTPSRVFMAAVSAPKDSLILPSSFCVWFSPSFRYKWRVYNPVETMKAFRGKSRSGRKNDLMTQSRLTWRRSSTCRTNRRSAAWRRFDSLA